MFKFLNMLRPNTKTACCMMTFYTENITPLNNIKKNTIKKTYYATAHYYFTLNVVYFCLLAVKKYYFSINKQDANTKCFFDNRPKNSCTQIQL